MKSIFYFAWVQPLQVNNAHHWDVWRQPLEGLKLSNALYSANMCSFFLLWIGVKCHPPNTHIVRVKSISEYITNRFDRSLIGSYTESSFLIPIIPNFNGKLWPGPGLCNFLVRYVWIYVLEYVYACLCRTICLSNYLAVVQTLNGLRGVLRPTELCIRVV